MSGRFARIPHSRDREAPPQPDLSDPPALDGHCHLAHGLGRQCGWGRLECAVPPSAITADPAAALARPFG